MVGVHLHGARGGAKALAFKHHSSLLRRIGGGSREGEEQKEEEHYRIVIIAVRTRNPVTMMAVRIYINLGGAGGEGKGRRREEGKGNERRTKEEGERRGRKEEGGGALNGNTLYIKICIYLKPYA